MAAPEGRAVKQPNGAEGCPSCEELATENRALKARLAEVELAVEELRRAGKRQSAPFSKGAPEPEPQRPGRKKGKAHGRHGHRAAPARIDRELESPLPDTCPDCGDGVDFKRWDEQFQTELPELRPTVTRFRVGVGRCRGCKRLVQGRHLEQTSNALGAAASQLGPRAMATGTWLHYGLGLSFGKCSALLGRLGIDVTAGAICSSSASTSTDLVSTHEAIKAHVAGAPAVTMDETGWRIGGQGAWLWAAATHDATLYDVGRGRGFDQATGLVPADYAGTIVRDGWVVYNRYEKASHQTCVAHLLRRCHEMIEDLPPWARGTPRQVKDLLGQALDARDLDPSARAPRSATSASAPTCWPNRPSRMTPTAASSSTSSTSATPCVSFLTIDGVDATNWRGEQAATPDHDTHDERVARLQAENAELQARSAGQAAQNARVDDEHAELRALLAAQAERIAALVSEIEELRARLGQDSGNSSAPPSRDRTDRRARRAAERVERKARQREQRGGEQRPPGKQPGAPGSTLMRRAPDRVVLHAPASCGDFGASLQGAAVVGRATRQVLEVPVPALEVTDHVAERRRCACGHETAAAFPPEASAPLCWGPRAKAVGA